LVYKRTSAVHMSMERQLEIACQQATSKQAMIEVLEELNSQLPLGDPTIEDGRSTAKALQYAGSVISDLIERACALHQVPLKTATIQSDTATFVWIQTDSNGAAVDVTWTIKKHWSSRLMLALKVHLVANPEYLFRLTAGRTYEALQDYLED